MINGKNSEDLINAIKSGEVPNGSWITYYPPSSEMRRDDGSIPDHSTYFYIGEEGGLYIGNRNRPGKKISFEIGEWEYHG